ncbi:Uncharacterized protein SCF082_LOCUS35822, partial [Durusdinium trenchii]
MQRRRHAVAVAIAVVAATRLGGAVATETCFADAGWIEGEPQPCVFPFRYDINGGGSITVNSCSETVGLDKFEGNTNSPQEPTNEQTNSSTWCSTRAVYRTFKRNNNDVTRKAWGYCLCLSAAPTVSPTEAPVPTQEPTTTPTRAPTAPTEPSGVEEPGFLESNQVAVVSSAAVGFTFSFAVALAALVTCAAQSMRYPFEDISASNVAARLAYHYDRAGIFGGCLTSGMGWRE